MPRVAVAGFKSVYRANGVSPNIPLFSKYTDIIYLNAYTGIGTERYMRA
jgi:hypothetical protein